MMEKIRNVPVDKPETLGHFLNRFVLTRQTVMEQIEVNEQTWFKRIEAKFRVFTDEHDVVFDSDSTSELGLLKHLEDNVCVAHEIDNGEYTLLELYLDKERKMEIDERTQGKRPLTCYDTAEARKKYVNQKGYFADSMGDFIDLNGRCHYGTLDVADESLCPYHLAGDDYYSLFMPEEFCIPEKKYEPYALAEFLHDFKIGEPIKFRNKKNGDAFYQIFLGYCQYNDGEEGTTCVSLGSKNYRLRELFNDYEVFRNGAFRIFGRCD